MAFTEQEKRAAWNKAREVDGYDKNMFRKDACGAWIAWSKYGARDNDYGWEIDHIYPMERGGDNHPENLRALHYRNNTSKADDYPSYMAAVQADSNRNVVYERPLTVNKAKQKRLSDIYHID